MAELGAVKLFAGLPEKELRSIGRGLKEVDHPAGAEMVVTGRHGIGFMIILEGEASVELPHGRTRKLGPGDTFGEMALLDERGRSATVRALTDVRLLVVTEWEFKPFLAEHPEVAWRLLQTMSKRLREVDAEEPV